MCRTCDDAVIIPRWSSDITDILVDLSSCARSYRVNLDISAVDPDTYPCLSNRLLVRSRSYTDVKPPELYSSDTVSHLHAIIPREIFG